MILAAAAALLVFRHEAGNIAGIPSEEFARLAYAAALLLVIGSGVIFAYRGKPGTALRHAATWLLAGTVAVAGYAYRSEVGIFAERVWAELNPSYSIERRGEDGMLELVLTRRIDGHFAANVAVNGAEIPMLVDTGASALTLSHEDARAAGIDPDSLSYSTTVLTANGRALVAQTTADSVEIGSISFGSARVFVAQPGRLNESLLGIGILSRLESYSVEGDRLILRARPR